MLTKLEESLVSLEGDIYLLAETLHKQLCTYDHTDQCPWVYEAHDPGLVLQETSFSQEKVWARKKNWNLWSDTKVHSLYFKIAIIFDRKYDLTGLKDADVRHD